MTNIYRIWFELWIKKSMMNIFKIPWSRSQVQMKQFLYKILVPSAKLNMATNFLFFLSLGVTFLYLYYYTGLHNSIVKLKTRGLLYIHNIYTEELQNIEVTFSCASLIETDDKRLGYCSIHEWALVIREQLTIHNASISLYGSAQMKPLFWLRNSLGRNGRCTLAKPRTKHWQAAEARSACGFALLADTLICCTAIRAFANKPTASVVCIQIEKHARRSRPTFVQWFCVCVGIFRCTDAAVWPWVWVWECVFRAEAVC